MKYLVAASAVLLATVVLAAEEPAGPPTNPASNLAATPTTNLRVIATHVMSDQGKIYVWVYDKKDDWLSDRYRTQKSVKVAGNRTGDTVTLELLLPPGQYALSVFQDINDDGRLARNFIGMPKEPAGLSNNVRPRFGPPKYKDSVFTLTADELVEQKIELQ